MQPTAFLRSVVLGLLLWPSVAAEATTEDETSGNLAICLSRDATGLKDEACLGWDVAAGNDGSPGGVLLPQMLSPTNPNNDDNNNNDSVIILNNNDDNGDDSETARARNWKYENGLLRAVSRRGSTPTSSPTGLCLGPTNGFLARSVRNRYELALLDCPPGATTQTSLEENRHMRFLVTLDGRLRSLAPVLHPGGTGVDTSAAFPFCVTVPWRDPSGVAYLAPCESGDDDGHQVFGVYGNYSGSFLVPMGPAPECGETVAGLAYQIGLPGATTPSGASIVLTTEATVVVETIDLGTTESLSSASSSPSSGVVAVDARAGLEGPVTALLTLPVENDGGGGNSEERGFAVEASASFVVSREGCATAEGPAAAKKILGRGGCFVSFGIVLACFLFCFFVSAVAEKLCHSRTRTVEGTNDGKTVCMMTEEEERDLDWGLGDDTGDEHRGSGNTSNNGGCPRCASRGCCNKGDTDSETDLDESLRIPGAAPTVATGEACCGESGNAGSDGRLSPSSSFSSNV